MGQLENAREYLDQKNNILDKIAHNTETQYRFIHKREMRGLKRVLRERDALIAELATINLELAKDESWKNTQGLVPLIQELSYKQQAILNRSRQIIQEAITERSRIAAELKSSRVRQQVKHQYVNPWAAVASGRRFNEKG